jgi:DNA-binding transcriptional LysR family regulator
MKVELSPARMAQAIYSRSLIYFASVAETGSIRESSRQLNVAASAVSRQLAHLQERLGVKLFDNLGHSLRLAPAGDELLHYYRSIVEDLDLTVGAISALHGYRTGTVRIATVDSFATGLLAELISEFSVVFPSIHISLSIHSAVDVAAQVTDGLADVGFTFNLRSRETLNALFKADCPMGIVVAASHPLASKPIVTYEECVAYPIGLLKPGSSIRSALERASISAATSWPKYVEATSMRFLEELAKTGRFVTFQPRYRFMSDFRKGSLVFVPLDETTKDSDEFVMVVDRRVNLRPAPAEFALFAKGFLADLAAKTE